VPAIITVELHQLIWGVPNEIYTAASVVDLRRVTKDLEPPIEIGRRIFVTTSNNGFRSAGLAE